jgi:hypothetical protein
MPSYPTRSASFADSTTPRGSNPIPPSTSMANGIPVVDVAGAIEQPASVALPGPLAHNSMVTDDAADGRPWPIDPIPTPPKWGAQPVPELGGADDLSATLAEFAGRGNGPSPAPDEPVGVSDEDRNRYGLLLDHAAERGLLSTDEYEVRLGDLAAATSIDQMRQIVTELPVFTAAATAKGSRRPGPLMAAGGRRRGSLWVVLGMVLVVIVGLLLFLTIYAGHLTRSHSGSITPMVIRSLSVLRL